jgi:hypothetical protein
LYIVQQKIQLIWGQLVKRPQSGKFSAWDGDKRKGQSKDWIPASAESATHIEPKHSGPYREGIGGMKAFSWDGAKHTIFPLSPC